MNYIDHLRLNCNKTKAIRNSERIPIKNGDVETEYEEEMIYIEKRNT